MDNQNSSSSASRITASVFGVYGGFLGFEHGIGEILQGNVPVTSIQINAYGPPGLPFPFGHEPAMTLLPTYLFSGILAAVVGLGIMIWSIFFIQRKAGSLILYLLTILLLLDGGGYGPIPVLILAGIAGFNIGIHFKGQGSGLTGLRQWLSRLFPWFIAIVFLIMAFAIAWGYLAGMNESSFNRETYTSLAMEIGLLQVAFVLFALIAAVVRDSLP